MSDTQPSKKIKGIRQLVAEAEEVIDTLTLEEARELHGSEDAVFVDIRDVRELSRGGKVPGAVHAPRGMIEFWFDPESPYHRDVFAQDKRYVLYCASGWRSALATRALQEMGFDRITHVAGGFTAWRESGAPVEKKEA